MKRSALVLVGSLAVAGSGCAHEFLYLPTGAGSNGGPAADYPIPASNPEGEVYVTSFGFTDMQGSPQQPGPLLHVRLAVSNGSAAPWTVNAWEQKLAAPGQAPIAPTYLNTDASGTGPTYQIPPGRANVFDLYFAIPPPLDRANDLGGFSVDWSVNAGGQPVAEVTSFQRFQEEPESYADYPPFVTVGLGFGLGWWGAPFFPYGGFPPMVHRYYYPPGRLHGGPWRGPRPGGWAAHPGGWRAAPQGGHPRR